MTLTAGPYSVTETSLPGYAGRLSADCAGTVNVGDAKTCTITNVDLRPRLTVIGCGQARRRPSSAPSPNSDQPAALTVIKTVQVGSALASDFTMHINGTQVSTPLFPGADVPGTVVTLDAGQFAVSESGGRPDTP